MNIFLRKVFGKRFTAGTPGGAGEAGHVFSPDLLQQHPTDLFLTLLREPGAAALSFYRYVNDRDRLPSWLLEPAAYSYEHIWRYTFRRDLLQWAETEWVQRSLAQLFLRQFLARIDNVTDNVAGSLDVSDIEREKQMKVNDCLSVIDCLFVIVLLDLRTDCDNLTQWRSKQGQTYSPVLPWTSLPQPSVFLAHLSGMPPAFHCKDYLLAAHLLLARYSAGNRRLSFESVM